MINGNANRGDEIVFVNFMFHPFIFKHKDIVEEIQFKVKA